MEREYFCRGCGLFYWEKNSQEVIFPNGMIKFQSHASCPNPNCVTHEKKNIARMPVDTTGFAYFAESHKDFIEKAKWSSPKYAPNWAIDIYKTQGIRITE